MTDDAQRWKEKYLQSLEDQEKLERRWSARFDLLRLGLVRSTLAAEGVDTAVDDCMKEMREVVRADNMDAALANLIPRLEKTVLASEQRREARQAQIGSAFATLVSQLQALPLPKVAAKPLKKFAGGLDKRLDQARELPLLLSELSALQGDAFAALDTALEPSRPGLLERWFKPRDMALAEPLTAPAAPEAPPREAESVEHAAPCADLPAHIALLPESVTPEARDEAPQTVRVAQPPAPVIEVVVQVLPEAIAAPEATAPVAAPLVAVDAEQQATPLPCPLHPAAVLDVLPLPQALAQSLAVSVEHVSAEAGFALPANQEPTYSSVAAHIESTLLNMLDDLVLPQRLLEKAESMRLRLTRGLNWYELLPLLDDLAVMVLAINDSGQQQLQSYLHDINERLTGFQEQLHQASQGQASHQDEARQLDSELREQVGGLHQSVAAVEDADGLKRLVESRLNGLLGSMDDHRRRREAREEEVTERMRGLSERVATMEREAEAYQGVLEAQRQKALLDPLTGLPNRAGWNERLGALAMLRTADEAPIHVAIMDLDHFKAVNDNYGHLAGDRVLKIVADQLRRQLREGDFLARFGGEEFVALFPDADFAAAQGVLEKMRYAIEACPFHFKGMRIVVTVSIGIAALRAKEPVEVALKRADQALYRAKDTGRNRIEGTQAMDLTPGHVD